ncbi:MAG: hypothetical protein J6K14_08360 [Clostridia bacterium]|nr:hypothetical protein [Clostridia bacterium]
MKLSVNFEKALGSIKPMHAVGQPPFYGMYFEKFKYLTAANIPYSRLHDTGGAYGRSVFVDIPNLFRDFDADENDEVSYDFAFTDVLLSELMKAGVKPYFRLGVTIENYPHIRAYRIYPPKDAAKWARICEHVIRHYNEGWANGFTYGIEYWEIWNEPDSKTERGSMMWLGTEEEYFNLYAVTAKHLKKCFGDTIKIGGFASCGFYAITDPEILAAEKNGTLVDLPESKQNLIYFKEYFERFLAFIKAENAPIDFFSYHSYDPVGNTLMHQAYVEKTLEAMGYGDIETHLNEWNTHHEVDSMGTAAAAASSAAMMCAMQDTKMSMMNFYDARLGLSNYCGLFDPRWRRPFVTYDAFLSFGTLYALGTQVEVKGAGDGLFATAATDGKESAILIANMGETKEVSLNLSGKYYAYAALDDTRMKPVDMDPSCFTVEKETFVFLTTKEIVIPE